MIIMIVMMIIIMLITLVFPKNIFNGKRSMVFLCWYFCMHVKHLSVTMGYLSESSVFFYRKVTISDFGRGVSGLRYSRFVLLFSAASPS